MDAGGEGLKNLWSARLQASFTLRHTGRVIGRFVSGCHLRVALGDAFSTVKEDTISALVLGRGGGLFESISSSV